MNVIAVSNICDAMKQHSSSCNCKLSAKIPFMVQQVNGLGESDNKIK